MSKTYDFLKECGTFFVATINKDAPASRPFGAIMELGGELYFSTANTKDVYTQLISNPSIQIVALKAGTRDWIRVDGKAVEINDLHTKQAMLDSCPVLLKHFSSNDSESFALFKVIEKTALLNTSNGAFIIN